MSKVTIAYHAVKSGIDCPDGCCAAWITARALALDAVNLVPIVHRDSDDYLKPDYKLPFTPEGDIYILDLAFPVEILRSIARKASRLTVIDHHTSNKHVADLIGTGISGVFDLSECAATAAWKYFHGTGIAGKLTQPWFLPYVRQQDIGSDGYYLGLIPESEAIGEAMSVRRRRYGTGANAFPFFDELVNIPKSQLIAEGLPAIENRNREIEKYLDEAPLRLIDIAGDRVPFFDLQNREELHRHCSMTGAKGALRYSQFPFVALTTDGETMSLRSRPDGADVEIVATSLGGGGHPNAAGYNLRLSFLKHTWEVFNG